MNSHRLIAYCCADDNDSQVVFDESKDSVVFQSNSKFTVFVHSLLLKLLHYCQQQGRYQHTFRLVLQRVPVASQRVNQLEYPEYVFKLMAMSAAAAFSFVEHRNPLTPPSTEVAVARSSDPFNPDEMDSTGQIKRFRSVILTSGTLTPFEALEWELDVRFGVKRQLPHVMDTKNLFFRIVTQQLCGQPFNSSMSFQQRSIGNSSGSIGPAVPRSAVMNWFPQCLQQIAPDHVRIDRSKLAQDLEIGRLPSTSPEAPTVTLDSMPYYCQLLMWIIAVSRIAPNGVLVFFPSYATLKTFAETCAKQRVQSSDGLVSLLAVLTKQIKSVFIEDRDDDFKQTFSEYLQIVGGGVRQQQHQDDDDWEPVTGQAVEHRGSKRSSNFRRAKPRKAPSEMRTDVETDGAVFFAVMRGKLAEGINFNDSAARALICVGLPYPSLGEITVLLKRQFQDEQLALVNEAREQYKLHRSGVAPAMGGFIVSQATQSAAVAPQSNPIDPQSGNQWYDGQAQRAVLQSAGRVIRHKFDYGALFLVDARFAEPNNHFRALSRWMVDALPSRIAADQSSSHAESLMVLQTLQPSDDQVTAATYRRTLVQLAMFFEERAAEQKAKFAELKMKAEVASKWHESQALNAVPQVPGAVTEVRQPPRHSQSDAKLSTQHLLKQVEQARQQRIQRENAERHGQEQPDTMHQSMDDEEPDGPPPLEDEDGNRIDPLPKIRDHKDIRQVAVSQPWIVAPLVSEQLLKSQLLAKEDDEEELSLY